MRIRLMHLHDPNAPIVAIKGVRAVTGLGLRQAKEVIDAVNAGAPRVLEVDEGQVNWSLDYLNDHNVHTIRLGYVVEDKEAQLDVARTVYKALANMPSYLSVDNVVSVLDAVL